MSKPHVPVRPGLFEETASGVVHLLGSRCTACDRYLFPRGELCPYCSSTEVEPVMLSDVGELWGWTVVHTAPPGYEGPVPFGFGVVELPEGLRVITRLELPDTTFDVGVPMRLQVAELHDTEDDETVVTYTFAPT
ncbi:MAG TPA: OB-fold domain-containing protein [Acidimicrobiia bacterium]|nr:OB-fold domain-containing protein [Acidimicrobiia bacterium]